VDAVANNIPLTELADLVKHKLPRFVAMNIFTTNYNLVKDLVESIDVPVSFIIGGLSTKTLHPAVCGWRTPNFIDVVIGDGEYITPDIVADAVTETPIYEAEKRRVLKVDSRSKYFPSDISGIPLDRTFFRNEPIKHLFGFTEANIVTSRGCVYNCAFCAAARSLNQDFAVRSKSVEGIVDELTYISSLYPSLDSIRVLDDLFLKTKQSLSKAVAVFSRFSLQWRSMAHVMTFRGADSDLIRQVKRSGCSELFIGIESGSPEVLRRIHKTDNPALVLETLTNLFRAGINVKGYFIYGFPGETESDFQMTYELACRLKDASLKHGARFRPSVFQFRPYHGTELYHDVETRSHGEGMGAVESIEPNTALSTLVGRLQFNFHSGNYSAADLETVHKYIYQTTNLNSVELFAIRNDCHQPSPL
jgi:radical SAM superfamily enzyme YgiQ (UPF0313 family)